MSVLPISVLEALHADPTLWPGELTDVQKQRFERVCASWPAEVRAALLSSLVDPERNDWSRAAFWGGAHAASAGAQVVGLATDDALEMRDARGERFALVPLGFRLSPDAWGSRVDLQRLLRGLDAAFDHRRYVLSVRKPIPPRLEVEPICHLVRLWLVEIDRGERHERNAVYESEDRSVAFEVTLVDGEHTRGGRLSTFGPLLAYERLVQVENHLVEAISRLEESVGQLPLVVALAADHPWRISRGHVQERLLGTPTRVSVGLDGVYEAEFSVTGRWALFSDPAYRALAAVWWLQPGNPGGTLAFQAASYDNPWSATLLALGTSGPRFSPASEPDRSRKVVLRWRGEG
jgi:hypothetical protein